MTTMMIRALLILLVAVSLPAQTNKEKPLKQSVTVTPTFRQWSLQPDGEQSMTISQFATIVNASVPITHALKIGATAGFASSGGDYLRMESLTDLQLTGSYQFPELGTIIMLRLNIPTGKQTLAMEEIPTAIVIGNPVLQFAVPSFGQGFNIAPGVLWAYTLHEDITIGLGASWQFRGRYSPLENAEILDLRSFNPGNEFLLTGGLDYRINDATALSFDAVLNSYELDKASALDLFKAGSRIVTRLQFQQFYNFNELRLTAGYLGQGRNEVLVLGYENETVPGHLMLAASFRARLSTIFWATALAEVKNYQEIETGISGGSVVRIGLQPLIRITRHSNLTFFAAYSSGSLKNNLQLTGIEAGAGIAIEF